MRKIILSFIAVLSIQSYLFSEEGNLSPQGQNGLFLLKLEHVKQKKNYCVPASIETVLKYYNFLIDQTLIAALSSENSLDSDGTNYKDAIAAVNRLGFKWEYKYFVKNSFDKDFQILKAEIHNKRPPIVSVQISSTKRHSFVFIGYNDTEQKAYFIDPSSKNTNLFSGSKILSYDELDKSWVVNKSNRRFISTFPQEDKIIVSKLSEEELVDFRGEVFSSLQEGIKKHKIWALNENTTELLEQFKVKIRYTPDLIASSGKQKASELKKYFEVVLPKYFDFEQSNSSIPFFFNDSYVTSVLKYDEAERKYRLQILDKKSLKVFEKTIPYHQLKNYIAWKVKNGQYKIAIMSCQKIKEK